MYCETLMPTAFIVGNIVQRFLCFKAVRAHHSLKLDIKKFFSSTLRDWLFVTLSGLHVMGHFPFDQKFRNFRNEKKWYGNYLGKFPENVGDCWISEMQTIQQKIPEPQGTKSNGAEISGKKFSKILVYLARLSCPLSWKFRKKWKMVFHSPLEIYRNSYWNFLLSVGSNPGLTVTACTTCIWTPTIAMFTIYKHSFCCSDVPSPTKYLFVLAANRLVVGTFYISVGGVTRNIAIYMSRRSILPL